MKAIEFDQEHINPLHTKELIRIGELLEVLPFGRTTIWEWAKKGLFPASIKIHGTTVWKCSEVLAWVEVQGKTLQTASNDYMEVVSA